MSKSLRKTVWSVLFLFFAIMTTVVMVAFMRPSHSTGLDPARIHDLRELPS